jgi:hypothetical protein
MVHMRIVSFYYLPIYYFSISLFADSLFRYLLKINLIFFKKIY